MTLESGLGESVERYFEENSAGGGLSPVKVEKASEMRLPEARNHIIRRRLRGDKNVCPTCNEYFNSTNAFDKHRTGTFNGGRRCLSVVEMLAQKFGKTKDDFWLCPILDSDRERLARLRQKQKGKHA